MKRQKDMINILLIIFVLLNFVNYFCVVEVFQIISAGILIVVLLCTLPKLNKVTKLVMAVMFILGAALLVYTGVDAREWLRALLQNRNIFMLLICAPMISLPFNYQDYQEDIKTFTQTKTHNVLGFLVMVFLIAHFLSFLISIGGILIVYNLMKPLAVMYNADKFFTKTITRSHFSASFWSPVWANVIIYSTIPNVKWVRVIPVAIFFVLLLKTISLIGIYLEIRRSPKAYHLAKPPSGIQADRKKLYTLLILVLSMIASILILNLVTGWDLVLIVSIVAIIFPLAAALVQKFSSAYTACVKDYYNVTLVKVWEQVALFIVAGFLARALDVSGAGLALASLFPAWLHNNPPAMIAAIIIIMTLPGFVGIHPSTIGVTMIIVLQPAALGLTNYTFALAMLTGWVVGFMVAPFTAASMILSSVNGKNFFENSVLLNWKFAIVCIVVFSFLISVIGPLMG